MNLQEHPSRQLMFHAIKRYWSTNCLLECSKPYSVMLLLGAYGGETSCDFCWFSKEVKVRYAIFSNTKCVYFTFLERHASKSGHETLNIVISVRSLSPGHTCFQNLEVTWFGMEASSSTLNCIVLFLSVNLPCTSFLNFRYPERWMRLTLQEWI